MLDLVSPMHFDATNILAVKRTNVKGVFNTLLEAMKGLPPPAGHSDQSLGWFSNILLAAGATLCDPKIEISRAISAAATVVRPDIATQMSQKHSELVRSSDTYTPPDLIIVDSLVFSDNYVSDPLTPMEPRFSLVMQAIAAFETLLEQRLDRNSFKVAPESEKLPRLRLAGRGHGTQT